MGYTRSVVHKTYDNFVLAINVLSAPIGGPLGITIDMNTVNTALST